MVDPYIPEKVLVVGGAGYVGSVLVAELVSRGYGVRVFDRLFFGNNGLQSVLNRIELVEGDMRSMPTEVLDNVRAVVNVGGLSNDPTAEYNPEANKQMNTIAAVALATDCIDAGVPRYIFASSCSIYDRGVSNETTDVLQDEESPVRPVSAYALSKYRAEQQLLAMASENFCPTVLRKGTIFGYSPRMRYDLVVNTFVKDALSKGVITLHAGGEMWRPLVDVQDVAKAYIACMEAPKDLVRGQVFNVSRRNYRISEVGLWVRHVLKGLGINAEIRPQYDNVGVRSYRVSAAKLKKTLGFNFMHDLEHAVCEIVEHIRADKTLAEFDNPRFYNIRWMKLLEEAAEIVKVTGSVF